VSRSSALAGVAAAIVGAVLATTSCLLGDLFVPSFGGRRDWSVHGLVLPAMLGALFGLMFWRGMRAITDRRGGSG